jgi:NAD(P)-dependent dehydrogenase (short-subunit alcohol dehydrogenase family)
MDLQGQRVVVTGAASGIGRAIALRMAQDGARLVVADLDREGLQGVAEEIGAVAVVGDAAGERGVRTLYEEALATLGDIDIWFANAGIDRGRSLDTSEADWDASWEVNVMAHVRAARLVVPHWLERGQGRFVVTASAAGLLTMLDAPSYSVTKHGAVAFAEWLSATYRHRGIVVQAICPQGVRTPMLSRTPGPLSDLISRDGALEPEDVAETVRAALDGDRFLVLPHPEVGGYAAARGADRDHWLQGMNRLQQRIEEVGGA